MRTHKNSLVRASTITHVQLYMIVHAVFFSKIIQSVMEGHGLGMAYGHIKEKSMLKACRANNMPKYAGETLIQGYG